MKNKITISLMFMYEELKALLKKVRSWCLTHFFVFNHTIHATNPTVISNLDIL